MIHVDGKRGDILGHVWGTDSWGNPNPGLWKLHLDDENFLSIANIWHMWTYGLCQA